MFAIIFLALALIGAAIHLLVEKRPRTRERVIEVFLLWLLAVTVGAQSIFAFYAHAFLADRAAESIGFPPGNPFQFEVACANLAFGVLGILCIWRRGDFWMATALGSAIYLIGAGYGHIKEFIVNDNRAPNNSGPILYTDILVPLVILALLWLYYLTRRTNERELSQPAAAMR